MATSKTVTGATQWVTRTATPQEVTRTVTPPAKTAVEKHVAAAPAKPAAKPAAAKPAAKPAPKPANPAVPSMTSAETDAYTQISATLSQYGFTPTQLSSLESWIKSHLIAGDSSTVITNEIPSTPAFQQRFPAIAQRMKSGLPPITVSQYLSLEEGYLNTMQQAGIPKTVVNMDNLVANDVSNAEFSDRVTQGFDVINNAPANVKAEFTKYYAAGVTPSALATYFLNPKVGQPLLAQQAQSALIGGAAQDAGLYNTSGGLTKTNAQALAERGVTSSQAAQGFQQLGTEQQLANGLVGQHQVTESQTQQVAGQFEGNAQDQQQLQYNATTQENLFKGMGSVGSNSVGEQGIGSVAR